MSERAVLDPEEQEAMDHLLAFMRVVKGWRLLGNQEELAHGVHTLQSFVIQHMLYRIEPHSWSRWYE